MSYIPHVKIVVRGTYLNTNEEWTFSLKVKKDYGGAQTDIFNIDATAMRAALIALFATNSRFSSYVRVTGWRAYDIGPNGLMVGNPRIVEFATADWIAGTSTYLVPPQTALCVTTEAADRGPARLGRFYLPAPGKSVTGDCRISTTDQTEYANAAATFLVSVRGAIDIPSSLQEAILVNASAVGTGFEQPLVNVRVGKVLDTIRRRRAQLEEQYLTLAFDNAG